MVRSNRNPDGRQNTCKTCKNVRDRDNRAARKAADPERQRALTAGYMRTYRRGNPRVDIDYMRRWRWAKHFGITAEQYKAMHDAQGGVCAICRRPETAVRAGVVKLLAVDHDHATGKVRGLLCQRCNMGVGLLADSPEHLAAAAAYLTAAVEAP